MMVQGTSGLVPNSGDVASSAEAHKSGGGGFSEDEKLRISEEGERNSGGNRWPRQETMALLKIRSDMDVVFRDSGLKGPLWEEVSRKLAELGYHRSAKKCKEKFENVYKYHKRTKDGRTTKADGKTYRFFDQLEALDTHPSFQLPPPVIPQPLTSAPPATVMAMSVSSNTIPIVPQLTIPSAANPNKNPTNISSHEQPQPQPQPQPQSHPQQQPQPQPMIVKSSSIPTQSSSPPFYQSKMSTSFVSNSNSSSSTSSDEEPERSRKRKRVWKDFFGRLMKEVIEKQEELQKNFLEALEKRERDRMTREEAWRVQEMAKMNREHEILVQERSMSAAKDAAVIAFLQKVTEQQTQQNLNVTSQIVQVQDTQLQPPPPQPPASSPQPQPQLQLQPQPQPQPQPQQHQPLSLPPPPQPQPQQQPQAPLSLTPPQPQPQSQSQVSQPQIKDNNGSENFMPPSPSRWPKAEIEALIRLRTTLDTKYQENAPKGPLWEEISAAMRNLGYNRNAKRCKEKWENINKYYKKVKESNKKRPEDAKTCPYFHQLEAIYKEKAKTSINHGNGGASGDSFNPGFAMKTENPMGPIMVQPEQQWPHDQNDEEEDTGEDDEEDDDGADGFEIVTNKASSMATDE